MKGSRLPHLIFIATAFLLASCASYAPKTSYGGAQLGCEPRQCLEELAASGIDSLRVTTLAPVATRPSELARLASEPVIIVSPGTPRFELDGDRIVSRLVGEAPPYTQELERAETRSELFAVLSRLVSEDHAVLGRRAEVRLDLTRPLTNQDVAIASVNDTWTLARQIGSRVEHVRLYFSNNQLTKIEQANWQDWYPEL